MTSQPTEYLVTCHSYQSAHDLADSLIAQGLAEAVEFIDASSADIIEGKVVKLILLSSHNHRQALEHELRKFPRRYSPELKQLA
jgi:uncharacterized protein involved in tolerance to divalent cations